MTATVNGAQPGDVLGALERADRRYTQRRGDDPAPREYLTALARAIQPNAPVDLDAAMADQAELERARSRIRQLENDTEQLRTERDAARTDYATVAGDRRRLQAELASKNDVPPSINDADIDQLQTDNAKLADQLADLTRQVGQLRADYAAVADELAEATKHEHRWEAPGPDEPIRPCSCGKPWPRYIQYEEDDVEPDVEPWAAIFDRLRDQLGEWGTEPRIRAG